MLVHRVMDRMCVHCPTWSAARGKKMSTPRQCLQRRSACTAAVLTPRQPSTAGPCPTQHLGPHAHLTSACSFLPVASPLSQFPLVSVPFTISQSHWHNTSIMCVRSKPPAISSWYVQLCASALATVPSVPNCPTQATCNYPDAARRTAARLLMQPPLNLPDAARQPVAQLLMQATCNYPDATRPTSARSALRRAWWRACAARRSVCGSVQRRPTACPRAPRRRAVMCRPRRTQATCCRRRILVMRWRGARRVPAMTRRACRGCPQRKTPPDAAGALANEHAA
eukprot:328591-Chlamydomonas_euryale.AAC.3